MLTREQDEKGQTVCPRCGSVNCHDPDSKGCDYNCILRHQKENAALRAALAQVEEAPSAMVEMMRRNNLVLENLDDPMTKLAFTLYSEMLELADAAKSALQAEEGE
jgi:hypothetical protein